MEKQICDRSCMYQWGCAWCSKLYCDCVKSCKTVLEGKISYYDSNDNPVPKTFFLCDNCVQEYEDKNIGKGRHKRKLFRKTGTIW